jgi:hypothetical protein
MSRADRSRGHALRSASGSQLLVLGILLAVFALWVVPGLSKSSHGAGAQSDLESGETGEIGEAVSAPPPDPTADAYRTVRPGDCLAAPEGAVPVTVDCAAAAAFVRVAEVAAKVADCPAGPGLSNWYHTTANGETTALCLWREFRPGQCFAARLSTEQGGYEMADADLRSRQDCAATEVPPPYNVVLMISEVLSTVPPGQACTRDPANPDSYWYWIANDSTVKVCATFSDT